MFFFCQKCCFRQFFNQNVTAPNCFWCFYCVFALLGVYVDPLSFAPNPLLPPPACPPPPPKSYAPSSSTITYLDGNAQNKIHRENQQHVNIFVTNFVKIFD